MDKNYLLQNVEIKFDSEGKAQYALPKAIWVENAVFEFKYALFSVDISRFVSIGLKNANGFGAANTFPLNSYGETEIRFPISDEMPDEAYSLLELQAEPGSTIYMSIAEFSGTPFFS